MELIDLGNDKNVEGLSFVGTLGFFDGVHLGHRHLIEQVKREALLRKLSSAVITFPVHPRKVLQADYQPSLLSGYDEKLTLLGETGIDYCISIPFTIDLSQLNAKDFIRDILHQRLGLNTLIVGYDHRFGHNREEGYQEYKRYGEEIGMSVLSSTEYRYNDDRKISSSRIRGLLNKGNIKEANQLLSYNYTLSGKIVEGFQVGRTIGYPTANMQVWERYKVVPALGVYAVLVHLHEIVYQGMLYIGKRPTLHEDSDISVEVNLFDFEGNLYNQSLTVEFIDFIRSDVKFNTKEELVNRIHQDKEDVKKKLKNKK